MYSPLIGLFLLAQALEVPDVGQRVVVDLRNGYRIEGVLIEKDSRSAVLSLESGEMRFSLKRVRRFHVPGSVPNAGTQRASTGQLLSVRVPATRGSEQRLSFSVPTTWRKTHDEGERWTYLGPDDETRFAVDESDETQSLWRATARIRRSFANAFRGFEVKQEKFGNRWSDVRTWEIDFEYLEGKERFRERRLYLDFGSTKRMFSYRTRAVSFSRLIGDFEKITSGLLLEKVDNATRDESEPGVPAEKAPVDVPIEDLERTLQATIQEALDG